MPLFARNVPKNRQRGGPGFCQGCPRAVHLGNDERYDMDLLFAHPEFRDELVAQVTVSNNDRIACVVDGPKQGRFNGHRHASVVGAHVVDAQNDRRPLPPESRHRDPVCVRIQRVQMEHIELRPGDETLAILCSADRVKRPRPQPSHAPVVARKVLGDPSAARSRQLPRRERVRTALGANEPITCRPRARPARRWRVRSRC